MSTRADFYIGRGRKAVWVGSIGHDAFPENMQPYFEGVRTEQAFRQALRKVFDGYGEISADRGWPWPWKSSDTTGIAFCFHDRRVWTTHYSGRWAPLERLGRPGKARICHPDMSRTLDTSPEGRLRHRLNLSGWVTTRKGENLAWPLLTRLAYVLSRFWIHAHVADGEVRMLEASSGAERQLSDLLEIMQRERDGVFAITERELQTSHREALKLLFWTATAGPHFTWQPREVELALDDKQPAMFGLPVPPHVPADTLPRSLRFKMAEDPATAIEGMRLVDEAHACIPFIHGYALAHELEKGQLSEDELKSIPHFADGSTPEARRLAKEDAHRRFWAD